MAEAKADAVSKLVHAILTPLQTVAEIVQQTTAAWGLRQQIKVVVEQPRDKWKDALFPLARSDEAKALLSAMQSYDDAFRVADASVGKYQGGFCSLMADSRGWSSVAGIVDVGRKTLAIANLIQAMFNNVPPECRSPNVKAALNAVPKKGDLAPPGPLIDAANTMLT